VMPFRKETDFSFRDDVLLAAIINDKGVSKDQVCSYLDFIVNAELRKQLFQIKVLGVTLKAQKRELERYRKMKAIYHGGALHAH
jgi:hypothetical protein